MQVTNGPIKYGPAIDMLRVVGGADVGGSDVG